ELVTESALLALAGALAGLFLARLTLDVVRVPAAVELPSATAPSIDVTVALFAIGSTALATILFGLLPALRATSGDLRPALGAAHVRGSSGGRRIGFALIAVEVALAM